MKKGKRIGRTVLIGLAALLAAGAAAFYIYTADYYRADESALRAPETGAVRLSQTDYGWFFDGPADAAALIFYPGALVEETAYAPLLCRLAENGLDVCLVKMPFHLAVLDADAADGVMARYDYARWYIGGHSLGGAMAANYAADHALDGVILLAAYPTRAVDEPMLLLYGEKDGVLDRDRVAGAGRIGERGVVARAGVGVADDRGERRAAGDVPDEAGEELGPVGLSPRGGVGVSPGGAALQKALQRFKIDRLARGDSLEHHADRGGVGLAENREAQVFAVAAAHTRPPFRLSRSFQKRG